ncbi:MAG: ribulose-phosphate 3-epimerase [Chloroflexia bacterium]|nr:ribulose-phosphate 3-epimerase [Chloroflexia bacterium]
MSSASDSSQVLIGPSVLSADFLELGEQLAEIDRAGADYVHFDVMDGRFVPNISIGLPVLEATRRGTTLPIDVHLMVVEPERWIDEFAGAGADIMTFHAEGTPHGHRLAEAIWSLGKKPGVAINPATPLAMVEELIPAVHQVLVMTVNPGFGGQTFIESMVAKIARLRALIDETGSDCLIQVDGGINRSTIARAVSAGARSVVAGSSILNDDDSIAGNVAALRAALHGEDADRLGAS